MIKSITTGIKSLIFAHYLDQNLAQYNQDNLVTRDTNSVVSLSNLTYPMVNHTCLLVRPLSKITDEDLVKFYHLHSGIIAYDYTMDHKPVVEMAKHLISTAGIKNVFKYSAMVDLARQLGYATDFTVVDDDKVVTYTADELVECGVFKYKEEN